ncbi:MAG: succinylglutamate desuccinylase/aspartoacylase family protein [Myxococcota bacterium]
MTRDAGTRRGARTRLRYSRIPILAGADLTTRRIAMMEARSGRPGPTLWITAGVHGDEVGGVVVVQEVFRRLRRELARGRVLAIPLLNPFGFETGSRPIPATGEDLNRAFPGDPGGSFAERVAHLAHARIRAAAPDLVLDLHNDWIRSIPYALLDPRPASAEGRDARRRARAAALASGLPVVDEQEEGVSRAELRSTLSGSLLECGVPALTFELGAAQAVDEANVQAGVRAVWRTMRHLGLVDGAPPQDANDGGAAAPPGYRGRVLRYSHRPFPSCSAIVRFEVAPGQVVRAGAPLATLVDVFGRRVERLHAEGDALVLGHADTSLAVPGAPVVALATRRPAQRA